MPIGKIEERIGFLGGGNIAFAIGSCLIANGIFVLYLLIFVFSKSKISGVKPQHLYVSCSSLNSKNLGKWRHIGAHTSDKNGWVVTKSDIIFICVKPNLMYQCAQEVEGNIEPVVCDSDKIFVSLMTGMTMDQLELVSFYDFIENKLINFQIRR